MMSDNRSGFYSWIQFSDEFISVSINCTYNLNGSPKLENGVINVNDAKKDKHRFSVKYVQSPRSQSET